MNRFEAVLFDLDGTLLDSAPDLIKTLNDLLLKYNRPTIDDESLLRPFVSYGSRRLLKIGFKNDYPIDFDLLRKEYLEIYIKQNTASSFLYPNVLELLELLNAAKVPWGIVTNKPTSCTKPILNHFTILASAKAVVCGDTLPVSKPHPDPILHACDLMGVDPTKSIYIGDCENDVIASKKANNAAAIACAYGYTAGQDVATWGADYIANQVLDIKNFL